jgi:hypothetical protein
MAKTLREIVPIVEAKKFTDFYQQDRTVQSSYKNRRANYFKQLHKYVHPNEYAPDVRRHPAKPKDPEPVKEGFKRVAIDTLGVAAAGALTGASSVGGAPIGAPAGAGLALAGYIGMGGMKQDWNYDEKAAARTRHAKRVENYKSFKARLWGTPENAAATTKKTPGQ